MSSSSTGAQARRQQRELVMHNVPSVSIAIPLAFPLSFATETTALAQSSVGAAEVASVAGRSYTGTGLSSLLFQKDGTYSISSELGGDSGTWEQSGNLVTLMGSRGTS